MNFNVKTGDMWVKGFLLHTHIQIVEVQHITHFRGISGIGITQKLMGYVF